MTPSHINGFSPVETARYTEEMVTSLSRIARRQGQGLLAHLLDLAAVEAKIQGSQADQDTALPG